MDIISIGTSVCLLFPGGATVCLTDGSQAEIGSGAGVYSDQLDVELFVSLGSHTSVLQSEIMTTS